VQQQSLPPWGTFVSWIATLSRVQLQRHSFLLHAFALVGVLACVMKWQTAECLAIHHFALGLRSLILSLKRTGDGLPLSLCTWSMQLGANDPSPVLECLISSGHQRLAVTGFPIKTWSEL